MNTKDNRTGEITKRILTIIDILAPYRKGVRADELYEKLVHQHGKTAKTTLYRDLNALHDLGFVEKIRTPNRNGYMKRTYLYRLDLDRTKHLQQMAVSLEDKSCQDQ